MYHPPASLSIVFVQANFTTEYEKHYLETYNENVYNALTSLDKHDAIFKDIIEHGGLSENIRNFPHEFMAYYVPSECVPAVHIVHTRANAYIDFNKYKFVVTKLSKLHEMHGAPASYISNYMAQADFYYENHFKKIEVDTYL